MFTGPTERHLSEAIVAESGVWADATAGRARRSGSTRENNARVRI
jgi:hypothetical protein